MAAKKRGLGRGLDALLSSNPQAEEAAPDDALSSSLTSLPVDLIERGRFQPRRDFNPESLQDLDEERQGR